MKLSEGVEWAAHCVIVLADLPPDASLPAVRLAEFHGVPPAYLAKVLQALTRAGIVNSTPGRNGGYRLARNADDITLLDVVLAADGDEPAFRCTEIRKQGPAATGVGSRSYGPRCGVAAAMWQAEAAWRTSLAMTTVADLAQVTAAQAPRKALRQGTVWLGAVLEARSATAP